MDDVERLLEAGAFVALGFMTICWIVSAARRDAGVVDQAWGATVVLVGATYATVSDTATWRAILAFVLVAVWGVRLSAHMVWRSRGMTEEWRHREVRDRMGSTRFTGVSLVTLFWFQAIAAVGVSTPLLAVFTGHQPADLQVLDVAGIVLCCSGIGIEAVADRQLERFRHARGDRRAVLATGLWRYSRHPNYFGDALTWWGLGLIGLAAGPWWALAGPAGMTMVLLWVTGVRAMDRHLLASRGTEYRRYVEATSSFVPLPPRRT